MKCSRNDLITLLVPLQITCLLCLTATYGGNHWQELLDMKLPTCKLVIAVKFSSIIFTCAAPFSIMSLSER